MIRLSRLFALLALAAPAPAQGEGFVVEANLLDPLFPFTAFGFAVAVDGDTAVVGAPYSGTLGGEQGLAFVFVRNGNSWHLQQALRDAASLGHDGFGHACDISGDVIVVGAPGGDPGGGAGTYLFGTGIGSALVFERSGTTWTQRAKLTIGSVPTLLDRFGDGVAVSGDLVAVGASGLAGVPVSTYVRSGDDWILDEELAEGSGILTLEGDTLLTSQLNFAAPFAVVAYRRGTGGWAKEATLTPSVPVNFIFGISLSLSGETALIGSYDMPSSGSNGRAYVFEREGTAWSEVGALTSPDSALAAHFGGRLALAGDEAAVASWEGGAAGLGAVWSYRRFDDTWVGPVGVEPRGSFSTGQALAQAPGRFLVGEFGSTVDRVVAYRHEDAAVYCTTGTSAQGCSVLMSSLGRPSASSSSGFFLAGSGAPQATPGLVFFGANGRQATAWGNGTSFQCVAPPVLRGGSLTSSGTGSACSGVFAQDLNRLWCPTCPKPGHNPGAGALVQAQLWYRDPGSTSNQTTSLSNAVEFVVQP